MSVTRSGRVSAICAILASCQGGQSLRGDLDYDQLIHLDAEDLAEAGIKRAYDSLLPELRGYVQTPWEIEESLDDRAPSYSVRSGGHEFAVYGPGLDDSEGQSWGRAAYALFAIVNSQMAFSSHRFYAINGGNDLGGMFLTPEQVGAARRSLGRAADWPYIPTLEHPYYGQGH